MKWYSFVDEIYYKAIEYFNEFYCGEDINKFLNNSVIPHILKNDDLLDHKKKLKKQVKKVIFDSDFFYDMESAGNNLTNCFLESLKMNNPLNAYLIMKKVALNLNKKAIVNYMKANSWDY